MNTFKVGILLFTAFLLSTSAFPSHNMSELEVGNDSSVLQPVSFSPSKHGSKDKPAKTRNATDAMTKQNLMDVKLGSNAAYNSTIKKKMTRQQFRQKILAYCKRYLLENSQHCTMQGGKSFNSQQTSNNLSSKIIAYGKREIKQQLTVQNPQAKFCASYVMYCRRFLLSQPKPSVQGKQISNISHPKSFIPPTKSFIKNQPANKTIAPPKHSQIKNPVPTPKKNATAQLSQKEFHLTVQQATAHLITNTQNINLKQNVTVEEMPQLKQPKQPQMVIPDSAKNSSEAENLNRRSTNLVLPPPIPNSASDADALFLDSPLKSHVKKALDADLGHPAAQNQNRPKILPVVVVAGAGASANFGNAVGTVARLLGKAGGIKDPTCTADCTAPHCTTECKCANTHNTVEAKCNPPSNGEITNMCQAWYDKCKMYKPIQFV